MGVNMVEKARIRTCEQLRAGLQPTCFDHLHTSPKFGRASGIRTHDQRINFSTLFPENATCKSDALTSELPPYTLHQVL